jgi:hypothetical protein
VTIATLAVEILAKHEQLAKGVTDVNSKLDSLGGAATQLKGMLAGAFSIGTIVAAAQQVVDFTGKIADLQAKTGMTAREIQRLEIAGGMAGVGIEQIASAVVKLQNRLADGDQSALAALRRLGIDLDDFKSKSPGEMFETLAKAIDSIPDPTERASLKLALLDKNVLPALNADLVKTADIAESLGLILGDDLVEGGDAAGDAMTLLSVAGRRLLAEAMRPLLEHVRRFPESLRETTQWLDAIRGKMEQVQVVAPKMFAPQAIEAHIMTLGEVKLVEDQLEQQHRESRQAAEAHARAMDQAAAAGVRAYKEYHGQLQQVNLDLDIMVRERLNAAGEKARKVFDASTEGLIEVLTIMRNGIPVANNLGEAIGQIGTKIEVTGRMAELSLGQQMIQGFERTRDALPRILMQAFTSGGGMGAALNALGDHVSDAIIDPILSKLSRVKGIAVDIGGAIASGIGSAAGGQTGAQIGALASGIAGAAGAAGLFGASIAGSAVALGAVTAGIGAAAVGAYVLFRHWFGISKEVKQAREGVAQFEDALRDTLNAQQKAEAGGVRWKEVTIAVRDAYVLMGKSAQEAETAVLQLWDTGHPARARAAADEIAVVMAMAETKKAILGLVQDYLGAGVTIPDSIQKGIDKLIEMGKLTKENAAELLGLKEVAVPSLDEIQAAAGRYGKTLEDLGPKVKQLQINETAQQIVKDFDILMRATEDLGLVMSIQRDKVQGLVTEALQLGLSLPSSMKPLIQNMIDAGLLTDEFGQKLMDVGRLTFVDTLQDKIDRLIGKLGELVDALLGVGRAADSIGGAGAVADAFDSGASTAARGGVVGMGRILPFARGGLVKPIGTDSVPALLTPGEIVLNAAQQRGVARAIRGGGSLTIGQIVVNSNASDPKQVAQEVARELEMQQRRARRLNVA